MNFLKGVNIHGHFKPANTDTLFHLLVSLANSLLIAPKHLQLKHIEVEFWRCMFAIIHHIHSTIYIFQLCSSSRYSTQSYEMDLNSLNALNDSCLKFLLRDYSLILSNYLLTIYLFNVGLNISLTGYCGTVDTIGH